MWNFAWQGLIKRPSRTAPAVAEFTIPILASLRSFGISRGIRDLVAGTIMSPEQEMRQVPSGRRP